MTGISQGQLRRGSFRGVPARLVRELADAARGLAAGLADGLADGGRAVAPFASFVDCVQDDLGGHYSRQRAAEDFALAVASVGVAARVYEARRAGRLSEIAGFACRHPLCGTVMDALDRAALRGRSTAERLDRLLTSAGWVADEIATTGQVSDEGGRHDGLVYVFEQLLSQFDPRRRRACGVYFTPAPVAQYLVARTDEVLRHEFALADGLAAVVDGAEVAQPLQIVDPAMGSGLFLLEVVARVERTWHEGTNDATFKIGRGGWSEYVSTQLLPRLHGLEIMPAPLVVAYFLLAGRLVESGFVPGPHDRLRLHLKDTLAAPDIPCQPDGLTVIVGNPPYRGISSSGEHDWIVRLMHGVAEGGRRCASYYHVGKQPLGERKHWLHDDYVKFFRWAQWQIERGGAGLVAFVTNHGFLDNPTFRGMRHGLMETFDRIELIDLGGNAKKGAGAGDQSVFSTAQGMATTVAWRSGEPKPSPDVRRADLRGGRAEKLQRLGEAARGGLPLAPLAPKPPHFFFCACDTSLDEEYAAGFSIAEIMPVGTTAVVTARDGFVIDVDRAELARRLELFRDLSVSDNEVRRRFFNNSRSAKYLPGDTRGWNLRDARRRLAQDHRWQERIRPCLYRPFDRRWIFWAPWMIDWPREEVMRHMQPGNAALVCRRQMLRGRACNFFWAADDVVIDGYIRSDNRGSESVFPLLVAVDNAAGRPQTAANFTASFLAAAQSRLNCGFAEEGRQRQSGEFDARDLLHYIYAVFHSSTYRRRYAEQLCAGFPRVPLPATAAVFWKLVKHGRKLIELHLPRQGPPEVTADAGGAIIVEAGWPKRIDGQVFVSPQYSVGPVSAAAWNFRVGAHQPLRKWLKDRRGRLLGMAGIGAYRQIVRAVEQTMEAMDQIDDDIQRSGGWAACFVRSG